MTPTPTPTPKPASRSLAARMTAKAGPLPVWAWALLLLVGGYLVYRLSGQSSSSSSSSSSDAPASTPDGDTTPVGGDDGNPPASGGGGAADNMNGELLSQLGGVQGSVDALTALIQSTPAFDQNGSGDGGSGSSVPNDVVHLPMQAEPKKKPSKPGAHPPAPATKVHYYTFKPGKAPKGRKSEQAPSHGPAGTTLHYAKGKGYYYA